MSIKSKRNLKPDDNKSAKSVGIFSLFAAIIVDAMQKVFVMATHVAGRKKMGQLHYPNPPL